MVLNQCLSLQAGRINNTRIVALVVTNDEHINTLLFHYFPSSFLHTSILYVYITMIHYYFSLVVGPIIQAEIPLNVRDSESANPCSKESKDEFIGGYQDDTYIVGSKL